MNLTPQQQNVVEADRGNLLISAAAGSGKTSVMTERITSRILSGQLDLRHILVMTFTNAAASNMRSKIESKLTDALSGTTDSIMRRRISEQISYLPVAHISTIHSFCLDVIGNFGYDARTAEGEVIIEPGFSTLDPVHVSLLYQEAVDDVLTALYELSHEMTNDQSPDRQASVRTQRIPGGKYIVPFTLLDETITFEQWFADFDRMTASLGSARSDNSVRDIIRAFHSYLRSMPEYENWIKEKISDMRTAADDFENTGSAQTLLSDFYTALSLAEPNMQDLLYMLPDVAFVKMAAKNKEYQNYYGEQLRIVREIMDSHAAGNLTWNQCVRFGAGIPEGKGSSASKAEDSKALFFCLYAPVKEILYYLTGTCSPASEIDSFKTPARFLFARDKEALQEELLYMIPVASRLYEVLLLIDDRYAQKKRDENGIDFSDYEHLALMLLNKPDAQKYYRDTFSEIYIDEYQDNSRIQDAIVSCFSKENCFAVGDVKQSIYRFRHARPQIFLNKMAQYRNPASGRLLELNSNFRSLPGILALVNDVFAQILSAPSGEIDYDNTQRLYPERKNDPEVFPAPSAELILVDLTASIPGPGDEADFSALTETGEDKSALAQSLENAASQTDSGENTDGEEADDTEDLAKSEKEAYAVIAKIQEMRRTEGVEWRDIAVLTRTNNEVAVFCDQLNRHGIPADGGGESEFLSKREILLMENLMLLLDNFRQDIPLAAVMRASFPQTGFTAKEMLAISLSYKTTEQRTVYFHEKVLFYRDSGTDSFLLEKVRGLCDWIDSLRSRSMYLRVSELIEKIYVETGFREQVSSLSNGMARVQALETFRDWANKYETGRNGGLYRFVTYIEDIRNKKESPEEFSAAAADSNAVHCMSIHRSKGLEFRYVFVAGMDHAFPSGSKGTRLLLSEKLGIGIDYIRPDEGYWYPTHYKLAMETEELRAGLAENMRLLYVAMTRAEERLFLVGCISRTKDGSIGRSASLLRLAREEKTEILPAWLVHKAKSNLDWCLMSLVRNPALSMHQLLCEGEDFYNAIPLDIAGRRTQDIRLSVLPFEELKKRVEESLVPGETDLSQEESGYDMTCTGTLSAEDEELFALQYAGVYPYEEMTAVPAKMSVSELKRRMNDYRADSSEDQEAVMVLPAVTAGSRPVNLVVQSITASSKQESDMLSAAERGTLLHSLFQYIDFTGLSADPGQDGVLRAVDSLVSHKMIRSRYLPQIQPYYSAIAEFASSPLCRRLVSAEKQKGKGPFREIPFSITIPLGKGDVSLVQGMIDCWFIEEGSAVLIDYKSDTISGTYADKARILSERYAVQLNYYAKAIEAASGLKVKERTIWLIPDGISFSVEAPGKIQ